jgi:hypothetical protein
MYVTRAGTEALAEVLSEAQTFAFTRCVIGDGTFVPLGNDPRDRESLIHQVASVPVTIVVKEEGGVAVKADADNTVIPAGTYIREIGFYAKPVEGTEILFGYGYTTTPEVVPPRSEEVYERRFTSHFAMSDDELAITVTANTFEEAIYEATGFTVVDGRLCQTYVPEV